MGSKSAGGTGTARLSGPPAPRRLLVCVSIAAAIVATASSGAGGASEGAAKSAEERDHPRLKVVAGSSPVSGPGPVRRFIVELQRSIPRDGARFAEEVTKILYDDRSWGGNGRLGMRRVDHGPAHFRVTLAKPKLVDRLCAPLRTRGRFSCFNGYRAVINQKRWRRSAASYDFRKRLRHYRRYLINHEVGHALGHHHRSCPRRGAPAPVMLQQTKGVWPCKRNWWPLRYERGPAPA